MYRFKKYFVARDGFTLVEVLAAVALLSIMLTSFMVVMNRYVGVVIDMQLRQQAFELARGNMEQLLSESKLSDTAEFGTSELNPEIEWQILVEPFNEPVRNAMWIRAVCSANFYNSKGELEDIELEHWITNLTPAQIRQIMAQQKAEDEYANLLAGGETLAIQETTIAYLREEGLDYQAYEQFVKTQNRQKMEYIAKKGYAGYEDYLETLSREENTFLEDLGMDFDGYNTFATTYVPQKVRDDNALLDDIYGDSDEFDLTDPIDTPDQSESSHDPTKPDTEKRETDTSDFDWSRIPPELVPIIEQLLGTKKP